MRGRHIVRHVVTYCGVHVGRGTDRECVATAIVLAIGV